MAKKQVNIKPAGKAPQAPNRSQSQKKAPTSVLSNPYLPYIIILLFSAGIYFNTLSNKYALDDPLIFTENKFAMQGFAGIKDLMTHDAFEGFFGAGSGESSTGGRYRPLSLVTFAMEVQFFGLNPKVSHGVNILLFTLTCLILYHLLIYLIPVKKNSPFYLSIPFIATMLFAGHPIHTEAVANIKGRDEIMSLLFSLLALFATIKYVKTQKISHLIWGSVIFLFALLSKENAVTFIAIVPLTYFFFTQAKSKDYMMALGSYLVPFILFLALRSAYTKSGLGAEQAEVLNNPFALLPQTTDGYLQRYATIISTFLLYIKLLLFPYQLTHDYYYNQVPYVGVSSPLFLLSAVINLGLLVWAIRGFRKKEISSYAILFYFITFSIVSNFFFTIGTMMGAGLLVKAKERFNLPVPALAGVIGVVLLLYSAKTISRNTAWMDNRVLFLTDVKISTNGSKVKTEVGSELVNLATQNLDTMRRDGSLQQIVGLLDIKGDIATMADTTLKREFLERAVGYLDTSLMIYHNRGTTWYLLGTAVSKLPGRVKEAIQDYDSAILYTPPALAYDALYNLGTVQLNNQMPQQAKENLSKAIVLKPEEFVCRFNLALSYFNMSRPDSALYWFLKALDKRPQDALTNYAVGTVYGKLLGKPDQAIPYLSRAIENNPNLPNYYDDLYSAYDQANRLDDAIRTGEQCLQKFPGYTNMLFTLANGYNTKGNPQKAQEYTARLMQVSGHK